MSALDSALSAVGRIGRYFSVVTLLPTTVFVLYAYVLVRAGGGTERFDPAAGVQLVAQTPLPTFGWLAATAVLLGLLLHPLQFPTTQLLEGYWGSGRIGLSLTSWRVNAHRRRMSGLRSIRREANDIWQHGLPWDTAISQLAEPSATAAVGSSTETPSSPTPDAGNRGPDVGSDMVHAYLADEAATKALSVYPTRMGRIMPTRLGNMLRRQEDNIGRQYGLRVVTVYPHLTHVAEQSRSKAVFDEQEQMDLSLRLCVTGVLCTALTLVLLARTGPWVFLALVPYVAAYTAYRAACSAAAGWMHAISVMVDLDRFSLYEALHMPLPRHIAQERRRIGPAVSDTLQGMLTVPIPYRHPGSKTAEPAPVASPRESTPATR